MGTGCSGMAHPDSWAVLAYLTLVALGIMFSLFQREHSQAILSKLIPRLHRMPFKKKAIAVGGSLFLVYFNRLTRADIYLVSAVVILCWLYGFSDWFTREGLTGIKRVLRAFIVLAVSSAIVSLAAWHFWPPHVRPSDWRTIKDWQKAELAPTLEQFPGSILHIVVISSAPDETWDYANQWKDFFGEHKWNVIGPETIVTEQIAMNVRLSISEEYWGKQRPAAFTAVDSALRLLGIKRTPNLMVDPLVSPKELVMWVGPEAPPGFPEHPTLVLEMDCRHPLQFTDDTMHFFGGGRRDFVRWVRVSPPANSRFSAGQKLLVVLTGYAKSVATSEQFQVQALGVSMPRPDALEVTITTQLKADELLDMRIISDKEIRVKCVMDRCSR